MYQSFDFTDDEGILHRFRPMAQGYATLATAEDREKDAVGYTNPNLHRRIDSSIAPTDYETKYTLFVGGVNSYRTTKVNIHDDESNEAEIP